MYRSPTDLLEQACTDFDGTNIIATSSCTYDGSSVIDFWISNRDMDPFGLKRLQSEGHGLFLSLRNVLWALIKVCRHGFLVGCLQFCDLIVHILYPAGLGVGSLHPGCLRSLP